MQAEQGFSKTGLRSQMYGRVQTVALCNKLAATLAAAQQAKPIANWANLNQLVPGLEIRVTLATGRTLRGFMQRVTPESLAINATTSQETLSSQDIRRVALKRPGHRGRNTLIGLAIGTGAGLALGAGVDSKAGPGDWLPNGGKEILSPLGALVGRRPTLQPPPASPSNQDPNCL
jgi:hypothetical protein